MRSGIWVGHAAAEMRITYERKSTDKNCWKAPRTKGPWLLHQIDLMPSAKGLRCYGFRVGVSGQRRTEITKPIPSIEVLRLVCTERDCDGFGTACMNGI